MEEKSNDSCPAGWWVVSKKGKEFILTRKTKEGSTQTVASFNLGEAITIASSLGGIGDVRDKLG